MTTTTPTIAAKELATPTGEPRRGQAITLDDKVAKVAGHAVRYRLALDTSYLNQSTAVVDLWIDGAGWTELVTVKVGNHFIVQSPSTDDCTKANRPEIASAHAIKDSGPAFVAKSWSKVYKKMARDAEAALAVIVVK